MLSILLVRAVSWVRGYVGESSTVVLQVPCCPEKHKGLKKMVKKPLTKITAGPTRSSCTG